MSEPYVGEIKMFAGNFAPRAYALCNGQLLSIAQNTALFSLLGTTYGGDGRTTFALPDLQSRVPMFWGQGPGLSQHFIGEQSGINAVSLINTEIPSHGHTLGCNTSQTGASPENATFSGNARIGNGYASSGTPVSMNVAAIQPTGGSQPHNNMQPFLGLTFIIALQGVFPPRN